MILFTQQMTVRNQIPLVMQKLCRREDSNSKKKKRQHKKWKINNSRAGEILTEKHNESHAIQKGKQISQQTQTHQPENQNYRQISATIEKENTSQQKFDPIHNVKYH